MAAGLRSVTERSFRFRSSWQAARIARMSESAPRRRLTRSMKAVITLVVVIVWTSLASAWTDRGCDFVPEAYSNVIFHGTPDDNEGCEDDSFGNSYTDEYEG